MSYNRNDVLAWCSATLLEFVRNTGSSVHSTDSAWTTAGNPYLAQQKKNPLQENFNCDELHGDPMVNEGQFFRGADFSDHQRHMYYGDEQIRSPLQNAKSGKKRCQPHKNTRHCSTPTMDQDVGSNLDGVSKGSGFRPTGCSSEPRIPGRKHKSHKPRNIARRNSPLNSKKLRQRHNSCDEPDAIAKYLENVKEVLQRIPYRAIWTFIVSSVLWALGVIVGLSWLFITFVWQCTNALYTSTTKWYSQFRIWLVKKFPFLKMRKREQVFSLPKTGEDAVQRLLKCKESDPYTILGVSPNASEDDIRKSYRSQAVLVHPDKNHSPKAEEAFKILASAFETLGNEEKRAAFDSTFKESEPMDLLESLKKRIEESQNIMGCQSCSGTHNRYPTGRLYFQARYCASCKAMHPAKEGDLWAETSMLGFRWHFYACLDAAVYDVTEWVRCQKDLLGCMEANTHKAPCRLNIPRGSNIALSKLLEELFGQK